MSIGKVILVVLATLVIFSTGLVTGVAVVNHLRRDPRAPANPWGLAAGQGPGVQQFLRRIQAELDLTPEQSQRIEALVRESQDRTKTLARAEFGKMREQIRAELMPPQRERFERLLKERQRRMQEMMSQGNRRPNGPMLPPNRSTNTPLPAETLH